MILEVLYCGCLVRGWFKVYKVGFKISQDFHRRKFASRYLSPTISQLFPIRMIVISREIHWSLASSRALRTLIVVLVSRKHCQSNISGDADIDQEAQVAL